MPPVKHWTPPQAPPGYTFCLAGPADAEAAKALAIDYLAELGLDLDPDNLDSDVVDPVRGYESGGLILVRSGDEAVGCLGLRVIEAGVGELKRMYLAPPVRGRGLGRALLAAAIELARRLDLTRLVLDTRLDLTAANRLYEQFGFADIEDYNSNPRAERFMALDLKERRSG